MGSRCDPKAPPHPHASVPTSSLRAPAQGMPVAAPYVGYRGDLLAVLANAMHERPSVAEAVAAQPGAVELILAQVGGPRPACIHVCVPSCVCAQGEHRVCMCACHRVCMCACRRVYMCACHRVYTCACHRVYMCACVRMCTRGSLPYVHGVLILAQVGPGLRVYMCA